MKMRCALWMVGLAATLAATGCITPREHNLPPASRLLEPGPGVGGPGPGVLPPAMPAHPAFGGGMAGMAGMGCPPMAGGMMGNNPDFNRVPASPNFNVSEMQIGSR